MRYNEHNTTHGRKETMTADTVSLISNNDPPYLDDL